MNIRGVILRKKFRSIVMHSIIVIIMLLFTFRVSVIIIMSGVWEALFQEEKQDWIACITGCVTALLNMILEAPCTILALISTSLILAWDFTCETAKQVSDLLALEEWWTLEHTLWAIVTVYAAPFIFTKSKRSVLLPALCGHMQGMFAWGAFLFLINGIQGGVAFGGKLFHPSLVVVAVLLCCCQNLLKGLEKEIAGYGPDDKIADAKTNTILSVFSQAMHMEGTVALFVGVFGLPKLDLELSDPPSLLVLLPLLGLIWEGQKWKDTLGKFEVVDVNGTPPQVAAEAAKEAEPETEAEPAAEEEKKPEEPAEEPAKEEEEEKKEEPAAEPEAEGEKKEEAAPEAEKKPNPIVVAIDAIKGLISKVIGLVICAITHVLNFIVLVKDKILGLPWDCIISYTTSFGILLGTAFAFFSLTEDNLALVTPALSLLGPFLLTKMQERSWLDAKGVHLGKELLVTVEAGIYYHLFRTYIALPA